MRPNLSDPAILRRGFFVEHIYLIVAHPFLCDNDFFTSINDKVAALVKPAILAIFHSLMFIQVFELAKVGSEHDWDFANKNSSIFVLENHIFYLTLPLASLRAVIVIIVEFFLAKLYICV